MKPLIESLSKLLEKLFSAKTLWFVVVVVAILASVLLVYANSHLWVLGGCNQQDQNTTDDLLGLCTFINGEDGQKQWIGLIALTSIIIIGIKVATWVIQGLIRAIKWLRDKLFVQPDSEPPA